LDNFYDLQERMKCIVSGDMACESLELAEDGHEHMKRTYGNDYDKGESIDPIHKKFRPQITTVLSVRCEIIFMCEETGHMDVWRKGDIWYNERKTEYEYVPDSCDLEDIRQNDTIYRPK